MAVEEFISNLRQVNGGKDFDPEMLKQIYHAIKTNEIIMPAEQQGIIREKYLWKCLLRKSETTSGIYLFAVQLVNMENTVGEEIPSNVAKPESSTPLIPLSMINGPIFEILWGPTVAAMTYIFDKINPSASSGLARRILNNGFTSCALLCATYGHLDNLIVSLCKFSAASPLVVGSGYKEKSQMAAICLFGICHDYANEIRESWSNVVELLLSAYRAKLLDDVVEIEDFALNSTIKLKKRQIEKSQSKNQYENQGSFLSYFSSYFAGGSVSSQQGDGNDSSPEDLSNALAEQCAVKDGKSKSTQGESDVQKMNCFAKALLTMIDDSKFFHEDSLIELVKALINAKMESSSETEEPDEELEDVQIMKLELLMQVTLHNRDRVAVFWPHVSTYLLRLFTHCRGQNEWFSERVISAVFRLAIRFAPRPDSLNDQSFQLLNHMTVSLNTAVIQKSYTAIALHSFIACCHPYINKLEDWNLIFNLLLLVGIGHQRRVNLARSGSIESEIYQRESEEGIIVSKLSGSQQNLHHASARDSHLRGYTSDSEIDPTLSSSSAPPTNPYQLMTSDMKGKKYKIADLVAYEKCTESLSLIIRDILPKNENNMQEELVDGRKICFTELVVNTLKKYVEVSVKIESINMKSDLRRSQSGQRSGSRSKSPSPRSRSTVAAVLVSSDSEDEAESSSGQGARRSKTQPKLSAVTESCALKLLDLMHHVHVNAAIVSQNEVSSETMWKTVWCPLLQGFALLCCDSRRPVRTTALTYLQKALLLHDLKVLNAQQWESCFNKVRFTKT